VSGPDAALDICAQMWAGFFFSGAPSVRRPATTGVFDRLARKMPFFEDSVHSRIKFRWDHAILRPF
jgi:hypothetical protein